MKHTCAEKFVRMTLSLPLSTLKILMFLELDNSSNFNFSEMILLTTATHQYLYLVGMISW